MGSAVIRSLPPREPQPGENPLRTGLINMLLGAASDPTSIEVGPLGMTRALKGTKVFRGGASEISMERIHENIVGTKLKDAILESKMRTHASPVFTPEDWATYNAQMEKAIGHPPTKPQVPYKHYDPEMAGMGAGGNLYDEAIYLSEAPPIGGSYARKAAKEKGGSLTGVEPMVRPHNIPPQAKILDIHKPIPEAELKNFIYDVRQVIWEGNESISLALDHEFLAREWAKKGADAETVVYQILLERMGHPYGSMAISAGGKKSAKEAARSASQLVRKPFIKKVTTELGYDGISFEAGRILGLPKGVPEGTRNYAIYNYDIINKPRQIAIERGFKKAKER